MRAKGLAEVLDGRSAWTAEANEALEAAVPAWLRARHLRAVEIPEEFLAAFVHGGPSFGIDLGPLPLELRREMAWCMLRIVELGGRVSVRAFQPLALRLAETIERLAGQGSAPRSLMDLPLRGWTREMAAAVARRTGALPAPVSMRNVVTSLSRCYQLVWAEYDTRPWWQREIWNPMLDAAIPRRPHEPTGRFALYFHRIRRDWLRLGLQWHFKIALETSALTWSTLRHRLVSTVALDAFLVEAGVDQPWLAEDPAGVRVLMLDFLGHLRGLRARAGVNPGQPLSSLRITDVMTDAEQFYFFMHDHREEAARALNEPGWLRLGPEHTGFWRRGEKPRPPVRPQERSVIDDGAFSQIMANLHLLGGTRGRGRPGRRASHAGRHAARPHRATRQRDPPARPRSPAGPRWAGGPFPGRRRRPGGETSLPTDQDRPGPRHDPRRRRGGRHRAGPAALGGPFRRRPRPVRRRAQVLVPSPPHEPWGRPPIHLRAGQDQAR